MRWLDGNTDSMCMKLSKVREIVKEKRMTEDEMIGWHHQFNGHKFQ